MKQRGKATFFERDKGLFYNYLQRHDENEHQDAEVTWKVLKG